MLKPVVLAATLSLIVCGCGSKTSEQKESAAPKKAVSIDAPDNAAPPPPPAPTAPASDPTAPPPDASPAGPEASDDAIAVYNRALAAWIYSKDTVPADLAELKRRQSQGLPPLPIAPAGKHIIYTPNFNSPSQSRISVQ